MPTAPTWKRRVLTATLRFARRLLILSVAGLTIGAGLRTHNHLVHLVSAAALCLVLVCFLAADLRAER